MTNTDDDSTTAVLHPLGISGTNSNQSSSIDGSSIACNVPLHVFQDNNGLEHCQMQYHVMMNSKGTKKYRMVCACRLCKEKQTTLYCSTCGFAYCSHTVKADWDCFAEHICCIGCSSVRVSEEGV